jgi:hypothetical protein
MITKNFINNTDARLESACTQSTAAVPTRFYSAGIHFHKNIKKIDVYPPSWLQKLVVDLDWLRCEICSCSVPVAQQKIPKPLAIGNCAST